MGDLMGVVQSRWGFSLVLQAGAFPSVRSSFYSGVSWTCKKRVCGVGIQWAVHSDNIIPAQMKMHALLLRPTYSFAFSVTSSRTIVS